MMNLKISHYRKCIQYWEFQKEIHLLIYATPFAKNKNEISEIVANKRVLKQNSSVFLYLKNVCKISK